MAGEELCAVGEGEDFCAQAIDEGIGIAAGEVCAAYGTVKNGIARKGAVCLGAVEYYAAG